ncbi:MAG TPA: cytochrome c biogenesis protein CcdA [Bryobacteraceae bacterium]|nr:cytochrome c biogenesis protein CcdA [Bryobacteraceae bacterium]
MPGFRPAWRGSAGPRLVAALLVIAASGFAQAQHVNWTISASDPSTPPGGTVLVKAAGKIDPGWHLYSASSPAGIPISFQAGPDALVESTRLLQPPPKRAFDPNFGSDTETYSGDVAFLLEVHLRKEAPAGPQQLDLKARYQTCNDTQCVPSRWSGTVPLAIDPAAQAAAPVIPAGYAEAHPPAPGSVPASAAPVAGQQGLGTFLLVAFGFGLASIFTPCVFPMIPITLSYFLKRQDQNPGAKGAVSRDGLTQALVFCLGIVVLFCGIGLAITALLGPFGVVQLGSNPWVNGFISALFIAFGLSLLGAFEITIPSSVLTRLNQSSEKGGFAGTLLMGLTFSLASFACVGPFVGTLLAASVTGGSARPVAGMFSFALGLALPFFLLALFPAWLGRLPRSGGWLARVKVVMGFVILAASLKYLASLDQVLHWEFLTRERFLAAWIVLFAMAGLYLLGFLRLEGIKPDERVGLPRLIIGMAFLIFAISLIPGMSGGRLGDLDAYVPVAAETPGASATTGGGLVWMKDQYREALDRARREGKLVFVNFTGYACANCHWMKANMFTRPEIAGAMGNFVLVDLYGDGTDAASEENQKLELAKFGTVAEPYYAILDPEEKVIATFPGLTRDAAEFLAFIQKGAGAQGPGTGATTAAAAEAAPASNSLPQLSALDGAPVAISGKVAVVNFWATWCVPCIQEIPSFNQLHKDLAQRGVAVVGVAMDEDGADLVKAFLKKHPMNYPVALGSSDLTGRYKLDELPVTLVFDRNGKQVKRFEGFLREAELQAAVRQAM